MFEAGQVHRVMGHEHGRVTHWFPGEGGHSISIVIDEREKYEENRREARAEERRGRVEGEGDSLKLIRRLKRRRQKTENARDEISPKMKSCPGTCHLEQAMARHNQNRACLVVRHEYKQGMNVIER